MGMHGENPRSLLPLSRARRSVGTLSALFAILVAASCEIGDDGRRAALEEGGTKGEIAQAAPLTPPGEPPEEGVAAIQVDLDPQGNPYVAGELLVAFEEQAGAPQIENLKDAVGAESTDEIESIDAEVLEFPAVDEADSRRQREGLLRGIRADLRQSPPVESADYNYLRAPTAAPNDPFFGSQWGLGQIGASTAWDTSDGKGTDIAIIDSGINDNNPDLSGAVRYAWDYGEGDADAQETDGHGTHVAGIAGALTNNGVGVAGTSPGGWLWDLKATVYSPQYKDQRFTDAAIINALNAAADAGADVVNMSFGGGPYSGTKEGAINYAWSKGVVLVASAGNDTTSAAHYPSDYPNVISVAATITSGAKLSYSNFGPNVDIAAPGGGIASTAGDGVVNKSGTSMASPHVAGVASLLAAQGHNATTIRQRLESTATDLGLPCRDDTYGNGLVNAAAAVGAAPPPVNRCAQCQQARQQLRKAKKKLRKNRTRRSTRKFKRAKKRVAKLCGESLATS